MARTREFCEEQVLDAAMEAFWSKGYEATSLADLMAATGLAKGSIYKAFGDKHNLFMKALDRYITQRRDSFKESLASDPSPTKALLHWFRDSFMMADQDDLDCKGCLALSIGLERGLHDAPLKSKIMELQQSVLHMLLEAVARGQATGEIREDVAALDIAMLLGVFHLGATAGMAGVVNKESATQLAEKLLFLLAK